MIRTKKPVSSVGVVSDTHGLVRPQMIDALLGVDLILHAGDIGSEEVVNALAAIAPVHAVRGNNDQKRWARRIPETIEIEIGSFRAFVIHDVKDLDFDPSARGIDLVVAGHSHRPKIDRKNGVLYLNPGSAGPRRFSLPISLARIDVGADALEPKLITLNVRPM